MQTLTSMTDRLATLTIPELRIRQEIVEDQLADAYQLHEQGNPMPDAIERMQTYQGALMQAVDRIAFGDRHYHQQTTTGELDYESHERPLRKRNHR